MDGDISWRLPFALQLPSAILLGAMIQLFPYSPRWLAMKDRYEDCLNSLCKLRKLPATDSRIQAEYKGILAEVKFQAIMQERRHPGLTGVKLEVAQWLDLFTKKRWRRTAVGAGVTFFQQLQGVNVSRTADQRSTSARSLAHAPLFTGLHLLCPHALQEYWSVGSVVPGSFRCLQRAATRRRDHSIHAY